MLFERKHFLEKMCVKPFPVRSFPAEYKKRGSRGGHPSLGPSLPPEARKEEEGIAMD